MFFFKYNANPHLLHILYPEKNIFKATSNHVPYQFKNFSVSHELPNVKDTVHSPSPHLLTSQVCLQLWSIIPKQFFTSESSASSFLPRSVSTIKGACSSKGITQKLRKVKTPEGDSHPCDLGATGWMSQPSVPLVGLGFSEGPVPTMVNHSLTNVSLASLLCLFHSLTSSLVTLYDHLPNKLSELKQWHWTRFKLLGLSFKAPHNLMLIYLSKLCHLFLTRTPPSGLTGTHNTAF